MSFIDTLKNLFNRNKEEETVIEETIEEPVKEEPVIEEPVISADIKEEILNEVKTNLIEEIKEEISTNTEIKEEIKEEVKEENTTIIEDFQFKNDTDIKRIDIAENTTSIGRGAFSNCIYLKTINFNSTEPPIINENAFSDIKDAIVNVPKGSLNLYLNTPNAPNQNDNTYKEV